MTMYHYDMTLLRYDAMLLWHDTVFASSGYIVFINFYTSLELLHRTKLQIPLHPSWHDSVKDFEFRDALAFSY